ncbi:MAG: hypothetical protein PHY12_05725 [Eubacteriales bacterium]|nr:hypothetical protein [Eubacteriales bacterium]
MEVRLEDAPKVAKALRYCDEPDSMCWDCSLYRVKKPCKLNAADLLDAQADKIRELETDRALLDDINAELLGIKRELEAQLAQVKREGDAAKYDLDLVTKGHRGCDVCIMLNKTDGMCKSSQDCEDVGGWRGLCAGNGGGS